MSQSIVLFAFLLHYTRAAKSPIGDISSVWSNSKISVAADTAQFAGASSIVRALAQAPAPKLLTRDVVNPSIPAATCDRDYSMLCPGGFVKIGAVKEGPEEYCTGASDYTGPCDGAYTFEGMSSVAKARWSEMCLSYWPCKRCKRDVEAPCPQGWLPAAGATMRRCERHGRQSVTRIGDVILMRHYPHDSVPLSSAPTWNQLLFWLRRLFP